MAKSTSNDPNVITEETIAANGQAVNIKSVKLHNGTEVFGIDKDGVAHFTGVARNGANPSFTVFWDGSIVCAKNGETGKIDYSGAEPGAVIQAAVTAAGSSRGGPVYIKKNPTPLYTIANVLMDYVNVDYDMSECATIEVPAGVSIISNGAVLDCRSRNDTIFHFNPGGDHWYAVHTTNMDIAGLTFIGNAANTGTTAVAVDNFSNPVVIEQIVTYGVAYGIMLNGACYLASVEDCNLVYGVQGITLNGTSSPLAANGAHIIGNNIAGFDIGILDVWANDVSITNNWLETNGICIQATWARISNNHIAASYSGNTGVLLTSSKSTLIGNHIIVETGAVGVKFTGTEAYDSANIVNDNMFENHAGICIDVTGDYQQLVIAIGNYVKQMGSGYFIKGKLLYSAVFGNIVYQGSNGLSLDSCVKSSIVGNMFYLITDAVNIAVCAGTTIIGNVVFACTTELTIGSSTNNIVVGNAFDMGVSIAGTPIADLNKKYVRSNQGTSTGTGSQQTIAHGLSVTPTASQVFLSERRTGGAGAYQSADPDATNIYVTAASGKDYNWRVVT